MSDTLAYLKVDFASQQQALIQRTRARYPGVWNDFASGAFGSVLIDLMSFNLSTAAYTQNFLAGENFLPTMQLRESAVRFGTLVGYQLRGPAPATVPCDASLSTPAPADVVLSRGTAVRTGDSSALPFELGADYTILAGDTSPLAVAVTFDPSQGGSRVIQALVAVTAGQPYADCLDTTVDLRQFAQAGQQFQAVGLGGPEYPIVSVEVAPGAISYNRLVLATPWAGATGTTTAQVLDRRVFFVQGTTQTEQVVTPDTAIPGYSYQLSFTPVIDGSVAVTVNGVAWSQVDNLVVDAAAEDTFFQVRTLATGNTVVTFGDGTFGAVLPTEATVVFTYRTGGGANGNVAVGAISASIVGLVTSLSNPVNVTVVNNQPGQGGADAESLDESRARIPAFVPTNDRAVTKADYQALATSFDDPSFGQVRYARAAIRSGNALLEGNIVVVYAWTTGTAGGLVPLSAALKAALRQYLQDRAVGTDYVIVADGSQVPLPFAVRFQTSPGHSAPDVAGLVNDQITAYVNGLVPGQPVVFSTLVALLTQVAGVQSLVVATPNGDLAPPSDDSLFIPPVDAATYLVSLKSTGANSYTAQSPAVPLQAWCFTATLGGQPVTVVPDVQPGFARLSGLALDPSNPSTVNLLTGQFTLNVLGPPGDFTVTLIPSSGYERVRQVDVYAGYLGDQSLTQRRAMRSALRAWAGGLAVGASLFAQEIQGVSASSTNVMDVLAAVDGVTQVTRVSLDSAANPAQRIDVGEYELVQIGDVFLNNQID
jgi:Baseplate J-like protein